MRSLVVYDSRYGNTSALAEAMAQSLGPDAEVKQAVDVRMDELRSLDLLLVGSPTHGGRPSVAIAAFLRQIPGGSLAGVRVAAFDTRFAAADQSVWLRLLMSVIGFAAPRIQRELVRKGGEAATSPEGFIVEDKDGPLRAGEIERARVWAASMLPNGNSSGHASNAA